MNKRMITIVTAMIIAMTLAMTANADTYDELATKYNGQTVEVGIAPPGTEVEVYIPDIDDDCPVNEAVPLSPELQQYIWTHCKRATSDYKNYYAFMLGAIQHESSFRFKATHKNDNGTIDRGICQINSSNIGKMKRAGLISGTQDLFDPYKCIDCGFWLMDQYINMFGISESAYYAYNTGKEKHGSNINSQTVMGYMENWKKVVYG